MISRARSAKYRIAQIVIEGFRAFTTPQTLNVEGKNLFLFGPNGQGKSSIIEAIRWCLFGRDDIGVRNTFYNRACSVTLTLKSQGDQLTLQRVFKPGRDRTSVPTLRDISGKEIQRLSDALPQLSQLGQAGAQVIFSAQHAGGRQAPTNIQDFEPAFRFYLGLEDVAKIVDGLKRIYEEHTEEAEAASSEIERIEEAFRTRLRNVKQRLDSVLGSPPWDGAIPTSAQTSRKIAQFFEQLARLYGHEPAQQPSTVNELLETAGQWIAAGRSDDEAAIADRHAALSNLKTRADGLLQAFQEMSSSLEPLKSARFALVQKMVPLLQGQTREVLERHLDDLERSRSKSERLRDLLHEAKGTCTDYSLSECPVCGTNVGEGRLLQAISTQSNRLDSVDIDGGDVEALRSRLSQLHEIDIELDVVDKRLNDAEESCVSTFNELRESLRARPDANLADLTTLVHNIAEDATNLGREIDDANAEKNRRIQQLRALETEQKYHDDRNIEAQLQRELQDGMAEARALLKDYRTLLARTQELTDAIAEAYAEALDRALPPLSDMLTEVYGRLTDQRSYPLVRVRRVPDQIGRVDIRVASILLPGEDFEPTVLNGQAQKALHIVPYLVFSRFQPELLELDLLLIDDPSESFDTSHVKLLVDELAEAAAHAQLVVASHEQDKFEPALAVAFDGSPYSIMTVDNFDPKAGPALASR